MCLPACADMVLAYLGHHQGQKELARILGATELGTKSSSITRLTELGLTVEYEEGSAARLRRRLSHGIPCIVFLLWTGNLLLAGEYATRCRCRWNDRGYCHNE